MFEGFESFDLAMEGEAGAPAVTIHATLAVLEPFLHPA